MLWLACVCLSMSLVRFVCCSDRFLSCFVFGVYAVFVVCCVAVCCFIGLVCLVVVVSCSCLCICYGVNAFLVCDRNEYVPYVRCSSMFV